MPTKKKSTRTKRSARRSSKSTGRGATGQLQKLGATIRELRAKLESEVRTHKMNKRLLAEAKKAREQVVTQMKALRDQGRGLAAQLKSTLGDANKREQARKEALAMIAQLRGELGKRTSELKRKSEELARLAEESAGRARDIIVGHSEPAAKASHEEGWPEATEDEGAASQSKSNKEDEPPKNS